LKVFEKEEDEKTKDKEIKIVEQIKNGKKYIEELK
jgi:hypothetical protein